MFCVGFNWLFVVFCLVLCGGLFLRGCLDCCVVGCWINSVVSLKIMIN